MGDMSVTSSSNGVYVPAITPKRFEEMTTDWDKNTAGILGTGTPVSVEEQGEGTSLEALWETLYRGNGPMKDTFFKTLELMTETYKGDPAFLESFATVAMANLRAGHAEGVAKREATTAANDAAWEARQTAKQAVETQKQIVGLLFGL